VTGPRNPALDLLRGLAVGLVLLRHALPAVFPGAGVVGIVMFFSLSGYLITGLLTADLRVHGRVRFARFYRRRALRLAPPLLVLVIVVAVVMMTLDPLGDRSETLRTVAIALTWTANLPLDQGSAATFHLWTLATEEQFYLLWPAVLAIGAARDRLGLALGVTALACVGACVATVVWLRADPDLAYALPTSWALCFVVGGAARILQERGSRRWCPPPGLVLLSLVTLAALSVVPLRGHAATYLIGGPLIAVLTATCILAATRRPAGPVLPRVAAPLVWLGTVSYAAYLWNYPLTLWLRPVAGEVVGGLAAAALTLVAACLSWHLVEQPVHRWSRRAGAAPALVGADR